MPRLSRIGLQAITVAASLVVTAIAVGQPPKSKRVLMIGADGFRADTIPHAETPNLDRLIRQGAFTDTALILGDRYKGNDTISGPGWSSILTGVWADKHGVDDNTFKAPSFDRYPHFFTHIKAKRPELTTASFVSWPPIDKNIVSGADIRHLEPWPDRTMDLAASAGDIGIDTRDGQWHQLVVTRRGARVHIYLDGQQVAEAVDKAGSYELGGDTLYLGRDSRNDATRFLGELDRVRIWRRALSVSEISALAQQDRAFVDAEGVLLDFTFETSGARPVELGSPVKGPIDDDARRGAPRQGVRSVPNVKPPVYVSASGAGGQGRAALKFDQQEGDAQGVLVPLTPELASLTRGDFAVEVWFRTTEPGRHVLLGNYAGGVASLNVELQTNNRIRLYAYPHSQEDRPEREEAVDARVAAVAAKALREQDLDVTFVYFHQTDGIGHLVGYGPDRPMYVEAIANVDRHVGTLLEAIQARPSFAQEDWLIVMTSDHGGIDHRHHEGHQVPEILNSLMVIKGPGVRTGRVAGQVYIVDAVPTVLAHLGIDPDEAWELDGRAVGLQVR